MTKTTAIVFIFFFSVLFRLEKPVSGIFVIYDLYKPHFTVLGEKVHCAQTDMTSIQE